MKKIIEIHFLILLCSVFLGCSQQDYVFKSHNAPTKIQSAQQRYIEINNKLTEAENALRAQRFDEARAQFESILDNLDRDNPRAKAGLQKIEQESRHRALLTEAAGLLGQGELEKAKLKLRPILIENPSNQDAWGVLKSIEAKNVKELTPKKLKPSLNKNVTLEFRDASLPNVFQVISRTTGINFIFDPSVRNDLKASIFVKDANYEEVIDFLLMLHQLNKKVLTDTSLLIYPASKSAQYEDLVLRSFYLTHAEAKQTAALIKQMLNVQNIFIDDKLNMLTLKANYDQLRDIEKLIADEDMPDPEVLLDVEILEVQRSKLTDVGLSLPSSLSVIGPSTGSLTLDTIKNINSSKIGVAPNPAVNLLRKDAETNLLANPRIRVKSREKAKIHIGDKIPIETTTASTTGYTVGKSASYLDVGLKLEVEPKVVLNNDVSIKVSLDVSNATLPSGATYPTVSTRNTATVLMSADGETQILAGLINDEDRKSANKVAGLASIPLLGRIFSDVNNTKSKTELVLLITPHVIRNIVQPEASSAEFYGGTGSRQGPINFNPTSVLQQFTGVPTPSPAPTGQGESAGANQAPGNNPAQPSMAPTSPLNIPPSFR